MRNRGDGLGARGEFGRRDDLDFRASYSALVPRRLRKTKGVH